jgi:hypothetical protein
MKQVTNTEQSVPDFDRLVNTWERAYMTLKYQAGHAHARRAELLTWNKPQPGPGNEIEHKAKIQALTNIIDKANSKNQPA